MMDRRNFAASVAAAMAAVAAGERAAGQEPQHTATDADVQAAMELAMKPGPRLQVAMVMYPEMTGQDLIGPHNFLCGIMNADVHLVWKTKEPVPLDRGGTALLPTMTLAECPKQVDVLFVPGGLQGTIAAIRDDAVVDFVADRGSRARWVTSVCTGSLVLGAAGLLKGYRATSHWSTRELLPLAGAIRVDERVVEDRNRLTGAGVTSGMDFGLALTAKLTSRTYAEMLQLVNEYDPQPPFAAGSPAKAGGPMTQHLQAMFAAGNAGLKTALEGALKRWPA
jgi:cyclohexyl-isocyanide hydratase